MYLCVQSKEDTVKQFTLLVDRNLQNAKGKGIVDFKAYFDTLLQRVGYIKAKQIMRREFHIFIVIK